MENRKLTLEEIQKESFIVLKKLKEIFEKNGWRYFLTYGTLIGAIRHDGFIPWDDDIDIMVPRKDYEAFIDYCIKNENELKPFFLFHYKTCDKYIYPIARFSNTSFKIDYTNAKDYGLGVFVDVYPLDGVNPNTFDKDYKKMQSINKKICLLGFNKYVKTNSIIKDIFKYPYYLLMRKQNINKVLKNCDLIAQKYDFEKSEYFICMCWPDEKLFFDKGDLFPLISHKFNDDYFYVPANYDNFLRRIYGDYMKLPDEKDQIAHHFYSVYRKL